MMVTRTSSPLDEFSLLATPGDYDGTPLVTAFTMDHWPSRVHDDRLGLAAFLLFRPWISGILTLESGVTPALAQSLASTTAPLWVQLATTDSQLPPAEPGTNSMGVTFVDAATSPSVSIHGTGADISASVMRSDQATGALRTATSLTLASNAFMFVEDAVRASEVACAVACLLGEEWAVGEVVLDRVDDSLARLMRCVGLAVRPTSPS